MLDLNDGNGLITDLITSEKPFSVSRLGIGEILLFDKVINNKQITDEDIKKANNFGGVYGNCFNEFIEIYLNAIKNSDIHCYWVNCGLNIEQDDLLLKTSPESIKIHHRAVEPYYSTNPWSKALKGKKVLVINSFPDTIVNQYKVIEKIWGDKEILPEFDLITYKSVQSIGTLNPHNSWVESLNVMKNDIANIDFDIALLGCGTYGLPLVDFIKNNLNKQAIYVGGAIQILFGIKGSRWDNHDEIKLFFNENWVRPLDSERIDNYKILENGCYW